MGWTRAVAVVRVWGLGVAFVAALALGSTALLVGDTVIELPGVRDVVAVLHLWPGLAAIVLVFPLVDRTPDLTVLSPRSPARLAALRLAGVVVVALPVVACVDGAGWSLAGAGALLGFVGVAAVACALLGIWYWSPMVGLMYGWIQWPQRDAAAYAGAFWSLAWLGVLLAGGAAYVAISAWRVRRLVRGVGAKSGDGRSLDTIRP